MGVGVSETKSCLCERVAAIETDFIYIYIDICVCVCVFLSMHCAVALENSTVLSVSKGIRGMGRHYSVTLVTP